MQSNTNLLLFIQQWRDKLMTKLWIFETYFSFSIFFFFLGFISGNLFGTVLTFFRQWVAWDVMIIILTILLIECINYFHFYLFRLSRISLQDEYVFQKSNIVKKINWKPNARKAQEANAKLLNPQLTAPTLHEKVNLSKFNIIIRLINFYKIGLLLGFFIDAFKVGS